MEDWLHISILVIISILLLILIVLIVKVKKDFDDFKPTVAGLSKDVNQISNLVAVIQKYFGGN
jgi:uncharacterized protein YoxC